MIHHRRCCTIPRRRDTCTRKHTQRWRWQSHHDARTVCVALIFSMMYQVAPPHFAQGRYVGRGRCVQGSVSRRGGVRCLERRDCEDPSGSHVPLSRLDGTARGRAGESETARSMDLVVDAYTDSIMSIVGFRCIFSTVVHPYQVYMIVCVHRDLYVEFYTP